MQHYPYREVCQIMRTVLGLTRALQALTDKLEYSVNLIDGGHQLQTIETGILKMQLSEQQADLALVRQSLLNLLEIGEHEEI